MPPSSNPKLQALQELLEKTLDDVTRRRVEEAAKMTEEELREEEELEEDPVIAQMQTILGLIRAGTKHPEKDGETLDRSIAQTDERHADEKVAREKSEGPQVRAIGVLEASD